MPDIPGVSTPAGGGGDPLSQLAEQIGGVRATQAVSVAEELTDIIMRLQALKDRDPRVTPIINKMLEPVLQGMGPSAGGGGSIQGPVSQQMPGPGAPPPAGLF